MQDSMFDVVQNPISQQAAPKRQKRRSPPDRTTPPNTIVELEVANVRLPADPIRTLDPDDHDLDSTMSAFGALEPIIVVQVGHNAYELVAGSRRLMAAQRIGHPHILARVVEGRGTEIHTLALALQISVRTLSLVDRTRAVLRHLEVRSGKSGPELHAALYKLEREQRGRAAHTNMGNGILDAMSETGVSLRSFLQNDLPMLALPATLLNAVQQRVLTPRQARLLARVPDEPARASIIAQAMNGVRGQLLTSAINALLPARAGTNTASGGSILKRLAAMAGNLHRNGHKLPPSLEPIIENLIEKLALLAVPPTSPESPSESAAEGSGR